MSEQLMNIRPTRMELLALRKRMEIAERGRELLREKLDALMMEFFEFIREISALRAKAQESLAAAYNAFSEAQMLMGYNTLEGFAHGVEDRFDVVAKTRSVIGVSIPSIQVEVRPLVTYPYSIIDTSARLDEATMAMVEAIRMLAELAGIETAVKKLAVAIASVKRRVNSLEYVIIPRMDSTIRFIRMYLEEREREDFFRLKRIKGRLESGA
ncbi:V-type ATP synthase subunit D [Candidatus Bathyarchaeota archaeon]|nr:V-type ATP synthase subunit D [Candidatus Bathyarchaeota archaeon]